MDQALVEMSTPNQSTRLQQMTHDGPAQGAPRTFGAQPG
jgi:hypothetical protein